MGPAHVAARGQGGVGVGGWGGRRGRDGGGDACGGGAGGEAQAASAAAGGVEGGGPLWRLSRLQTGHEELLLAGALRVEQLCVVLEEPVLRVQARTRVGQRGAGAGKTGGGAGKGGDGEGCEGAGRRGGGRAGGKRLLRWRILVASNILRAFAACSSLVGPTCVPASAPSWAPAPPKSGAVAAGRPVDSC